MPKFLRVRKTVIKSINNGFLRVLNSAWSDYIKSLIFIRDIVFYMERVYVSQSDLPVNYKFLLHKIWFELKRKSQI